jgi:hypothetical protein
MCSGSHDVEFLAKLESAHEHMTSRIDNYVDAWNRGDIDFVMNTFVEKGLDYTDYGELIFPQLLGLEPPGYNSALTFEYI